MVIYSFYSKWTYILHFWTLLDSSAKEKKKEKHIIPFVLYKLNDIGLEKIDYIKAKQRESLRPTHST